MKNIFGEELESVVFISQEQLINKELKQLYGRYFEDTKIYNILPDNLKCRGEYLGPVLSLGTSPDQYKFCGIVAENGLEFYEDGKKLQIEDYSLYQSIFSRNNGILETDVMAGKRVVVLGCGSVGSLVAMELARAGVEHFLLADPDIVEYHNICRHQCGIEDVGDLKINAITRKLMNINPRVKVKKFEGIIENMPKEMLDEFCIPRETIFVGCADNRAADVYANRISIYYSAFFISIGFWERAYAGEIFYHIPDKGMPCYECALGNGGNISARAQANHHVYSNQEHIEGLKFEPGISVDINFITTIGIKLIIDIVNSTNEEYVPRLLNDLRQYTIICNTNNSEIGGEMVEIFSYPLQVSTSLMVAFGNTKCKGEGRCKYEMKYKG